jgi:hypothetical protein
MGHVIPCQVDAGWQVLSEGRRVGSWGRKLEWKSKAQFNGHTVDNGIRLTKSDHRGPCRPIELWSNEPTLEIFFKPLAQ